MTLSENIRRRRKALGLSLGQVAYRVNGLGRLSGPQHAEQLGAGAERAAGIGPGATGGGPAHHPGPAGGLGGRDQQTMKEALPR